VNDNEDLNKPIQS